MPYGFIHEPPQAETLIRRAWLKYCAPRESPRSTEFQLLNILAQKPGRIFSRNQLMDRLYPDQRIICDRTIDSHIKNLRKKITAAAPDLELIHSIYGVGYKYENL